MHWCDGLRGRARWTAAAVVLLCCTACWTMAGAENVQLKLVSTAWPPFTNAPKQPRFALDLVEAALRRIDVTASTAIVSAPQYSTALLAGVFDGSGAAWKDPERERELVFS